MISLPDSISTYLNNHSSDVEVSGYVCLHDNHTVVSADGSIGKIELENLEKSENILDAIPFLEGLLPDKIKKSAIINNVHTDTNQYFNVHLFSDNVGHWVIFIDTTHSAKKLQQEQQQRLDIDFDNDLKNTGS